MVDQYDSADRIVTFVGAGNYYNANYHFGAYEESKAGKHYKFTTEFLAHRLGAREVVALVTQEARANGQELKGNLEPGVAVTLVDISAGDTLADVWSVFTAVTDALDVAEGQRVVLDITNGFRSLPFLAGMVLQYVRTQYPGRPRIPVYYGAYAKSDDPQSPVWDLAPVAALAEWAQDFAMLQQTGRVSDQLLANTEQLRPSGAEVAHRDDHNALKTLGKELQKFSDAFETVRLRPLVLGGDEDGLVPGLFTALEAAEQAAGTYAPPLKKILARLKERIQPLNNAATGFHESEAHHALVALAKLYLETGRIVEAAAVSHETWGMLGLGEVKALPCDKDLKTILARARARLIRSDQQAKQHSRSLAEARNDLLHGGLRANSSPGGRLRQQLAQRVSDLEAAVQAPPALTPAAKPLFLNLSNHPLSTWSDAQRQRAEAFADDLVELEFPEVPVDMPGAEIGELADRILKQVRALEKEHGGQVDTAMVQGEMTLTVALVRRLQQGGVRVLAATTDHDPRGGFVFAGFRDYPV